MKGKNLIKEHENGLMPANFEYLVINLSGAYEKKLIRNSFTSEPEGQTKFFDDLLFPLAEEEGLIVNSPTLYKSYIHQANLTHYVIEGMFFDLETFILTKIKFYLQHHNNSNLTIEEACLNAVSNGDYEIELVSEEVISADGIEIDLTDGKYQSASNIIDENEK